MVCSVISSSLLVNQPEVAGQLVTLSCESGGSKLAGTRHSCGMDSLRAARFFAPISSQFCADMFTLVEAKSDTDVCEIVSFRRDVSYKQLHLTKVGYKCNTHFWCSGLASSRVSCYL